MKRPLLVIILSLLLPGYLTAGLRVDSILALLNQELDNRVLYSEQKEKEQNNLKKQVATTADLRTTFNLYTQIYEGYSYYQNDSAHTYAMNSLQIAEKLGDKTSQMIARCNLLNCYILTGLYHESIEWMNGMDIAGEAPEIKARFYEAGTILYSNLSSYNYGTPFHSQTIEIMNHYIDSSLIYLQEANPLEYEKARVRRRPGKMERDSLVRHFYSILDRFDYTNHEKAMIYCGLGNLHYQQGDSENGICCYALAAIHDIRDCIRETVALRELARALTEEGKVMAGSKYMAAALEDANFYNTRHRKREVNAVLPGVEREKLQIIEKQKRMFSFYLTLVSCLLAALLVAFYVIYRQIRKLRQAKRAIEKQFEKISVINTELEKSRRKQEEINDRLEKTNYALQESTEIKDQYIIQSLYGKSEYMDRFEELIYKVDRKVASRQYEDLRTLHKDFNMKMERGNMFSDFDHTFLLLFPDFVSEYNKLFRQQDHVTPDENGNLSTELRIFALIRLGITENERISRFLKLSVNTIYVYKAKAKNKAIVPKEEFEYRIMQIKKPKM